MLDYGQKVDSAFVAKYGDSRNLCNSQRLNLRHDLAKAMLSTKYSRLADELEKKAKAEHKVKMDEWDMILEDISLAGNVAQFVFFSPLPGSLTHVSPQGLETPSLTPYTPSFMQLVPMLAAMSHLLPEILKRLLMTKDFSLRESAFPRKYFGTNTLEQSSLVARRPYLDKELDTVGPREV